jgi:nucleotide-binding universal stress UspA family protein
MKPDAEFDVGGILACVSEGAQSDHAVSVAVDLAEKLDARLELVHAVQVPDLLATRFDTSQIAAMNAERVAESRKDILAHFAEAHAGRTVGGTGLEELLHVVPGNPSKLLVDRAEQDDVDLLVIGDSGKHKNLDFGGVGRALLSHAPCPLWLQVAPPAPIESVLVPVDLSEHSFAALRTAVDLAGRLKARVAAIHCFTVNEYAYVGVPYGAGYASTWSPGDIRDDVRGDFEKRLEAFEWGDVEHETIFAEDVPAAGILARQDDFDLIVMGTHGRTGLAAALLGGVAYRVLRTSKTPVLAIRQPDRPWLL